MMKDIRSLDGCRYWIDGCFYRISRTQRERKSPLPHTRLLLRACVTAKILCPFALPTSIHGPCLSPCFHWHHWIERGYILQFSIYQRLIFQYIHTVMQELKRKIQKTRPNRRSTKCRAHSPKSPTNLRNCKVALVTGCKIMEKTAFRYSLWAIFYIDKEKPMERSMYWPCFAGRTKADKVLTFITCFPPQKNTSYLSLSTSI